MKAVIKLKPHGVLYGHYCVEIYYRGKLVHCVYVEAKPAASKLVVQRQPRTRIDPVSGEVEVVFHLS
jgi:hypothetical protein